MVATVAFAAATTLLVTTPAAANPNVVNPIPYINGVIGLPTLRGPAQPVAHTTGLLSENQTQNLNMLGTDLGIMWDNGKGEILTAFGDTAGFGVPNIFQGSVWSWKSSTLLRSRDGNLADGMHFDSAVRDLFGQAKELVPSPKIPFVEISRIPTAGVAVGDTQFMSMMSVKNWGQAGSWETNFSGLVASADNGETWRELPETNRPSDGGNRNFQQTSFVKADGYVYEFGTPPGRNQLVHLARVKEADITKLGEYEYWTGSEFKKGDPLTAAPITGGSAELSVAYNATLGQWLMLTTDPWNSVVMRRAPSITGPWSTPEVLVDTRDLTSAYAPYIHPWSTGRELYFLTTVHQNYNVLLLKTSL